MVQLVHPASVHLFMKVSFAGTSGALTSGQFYKIIIGTNHMRAANICIYIYIYAYGIVCTDLSGKGPDTQEGVGRMLSSGSLSGAMVSTLARDARDVGSSPTLGRIFSVFITLIILAP